MAEGFYLHPKTKRVTRGEIVVLQQVGEMADGKLHFIAGTDETVFNLEENDKFYTAIFAVNPFEEKNAGD